MKPEKPKLAGLISNLFIKSKLTPIIVIASLLLGLGAIWITPKEEEPQIVVPMIDIQLSTPGMNAPEAERFVTEVVERELWGIEGVEYIYSATQAHRVLITVRFKVGQNIEASLVKIHHHMMALASQLPPQVNVQSIRSLSVDDVPFLAVSFSSAKLSDVELRKTIAPIARQLSSTPEVARTELLGGRKQVIHVQLDPERLAANGVSAADVARALRHNHAYVPLGKNWSATRVLDVELDAQIADISQIRQLPIAQRGGKVITIESVASVSKGPEIRTRASLILDKSIDGTPRNAVTLVFSKRKGTNVVELSKQLLTQLATLEPSLPNDIKSSIIRNDGESANEKTKTLVEHLLIATLSVSALIAIFMGLRAATVVVIAIPVTLALTLFIYYILGYTLNRVTFFALIFSIGILVDDAIVVVENIERHLNNDDNKGLLSAISAAVSEVGNPTILATFTVIAAILPMAFVRGLMGPYMKPIPVGASLAMIVSLFVAFSVTPWASRFLLKKSTHPHQHESGKLTKLYEKIMEHLLRSRWAAVGFFALVATLLLAAFSLVGFKAVKVKMLPFDNKNEFQITLDFPTDTPIDLSLEISKQLATSLSKNRDVEKIQLFVGEPAPFSFSGMVKHSFLRGNDYQVDLHMVLVDKAHRRRSSHDVIKALRPQLAVFSKKHHVVSKVLEIPPGPPVLATMVAEVYAPTRELQAQAVATVRQAFESNASLVDIDDTQRLLRARQLLRYDFHNGGRSGASAIQVAEIGQTIYSENSVLILNRADSPESLDVVLSTAPQVRSGNRPFSNQMVKSFDSGLAAISTLIATSTVTAEPILHRKNLRPVSYVTAELSGDEEAPVYPILDLNTLIPFEIRTVDIPWPLFKTVIKWDGEWFITYEVFRDLGAAFFVVMILIYVLILGWFKRFLLPLVIMAPIPISLIGIIPGHFVTGAYFTATSMIGFIAGAGIIVRNSIILVDFIESELANGKELKQAVIGAGVTRFRPMLLTAGAVVVGSMVMLSDPIFQGLAVSLMFGEVAATLLSRFAVPILYYHYSTIFKDTPIS